MEIQLHKPEKMFDGRVNKLLLTGVILTSITTGWLLGIITNDAYSQSTEQVKGFVPQNSILLPAVSMNGESLPTIVLSELSIHAKK